MAVEMAATLGSTTKEKARASAAFCVVLPRRHCSPLKLSVTLLIVMPKHSAERTFTRTFSTRTFLRGPRSP